MFPLNVAPNNLEQKTDKSQSHSLHIQLVKLRAAVSVQTKTQLFVLLIELSVRPHPS